MRAVIKSRRAGTPTFAMRAPERLRPPKRTRLRTCHPPRRQTRSQEQPTRLMNDGDWGPDPDVQDIIESRERRRRQDRLELARRRSTQDRLLDSHDVDLNAPENIEKHLAEYEAGAAKWRRSKEYRRTVQQSSPSHDRDDDGDEEYEEEDEHEEPEEEEPPQRPARPPSWAKKQKEAADLPAKKSTKKRIKEPPNTRSAVAPRRFLQIDLDLLRRKDMTLTEKVVYAYLRNIQRLAQDKGSGTVAPRQTTIADYFGITRQRVATALKGLEEKGWIKRRRRGHGKATIYKFLK